MKQQKTSQEKSDLEENNQSLSEELKEAQSQVEVLREMANLKDEGYFRLRLTQQLDTLNLSIKNLTKVVEELSFEDEEENEDNN